MDIAIVGSGISGLVSAYLLAPRHRVTVFEADARIGGHTHTVPVELDGERHEVDTGFIVYNEPNYPHFTRLLARLGVASKPTEMSFSVRCDRTGVEYGGTNLAALFAQRRNLVSVRHWRMLAGILKFHRTAPALLADDTDGPSVADWCRARGLGNAFLERYLVPLGSALWSCPEGTFRDFPMRFVAEFMANHALLQVDGRPTWRVVAGGSARYVERLVETFRDRIRLASPVRRIERRADGVDVSSPAGTERFDHVVLACHADQALRLVAAPTRLEEEVLRAFPYQRNAATLHTDTSVLPLRPVLWSSWNARLRADGRFSATYDMNVLQGIRSRHTFCVSINEDAVDPARVLGRFVYEHPVFVRGRLEAQRRHAELCSGNRTSYCGAYWGWGFHEDGVASAVAACRALDEESTLPLAA